MRRFEKTIVSGLKQEWWLCDVAAECGVAPGVCASRWDGCWGSDDRDGKHWPRRDVTSTKACPPKAKACPLDVSILLPAIVPPSLHLDTAAGIHCYCPLLPPARSSLARRRAAHRSQTTHVVVLQRVRCLIELLADCNTKTQVP